MSESIVFCNKDEDRFVAEMIAKKHEILPELNDDNAAAVNIAIIELVAAQLAWLTYQLNVIGNQNYIKTCTLWAALKALCDLLAYQIPTATPARTNLTITFDDSVLDDTIILPKWTQFSTSGSSTEEKIIFEAETEINKVPGNLTVTIPVVQGERTAGEILGSSDGEGFQTFTLENSPVIIDDSFEVYVIDETLVTTEKWERVTSLMAYDSTAKVYEIDYDEDTQVTVKFGNGTYGKIPPIGTNNIYTNYRTGGLLLLGNVGAGKIMQMVAEVTGFDSCTNTIAATGGTNRESMQLTKMKAPRSIKYSDRVVAAEDYGIRAMEYTGVVRATQFPREFGENTTGVRIVPTDSTLAGTQLMNLCTEVEHFITSVNTTTHDVFVTPVKYHTVDIDAIVYIAADADEDEVETAIDTALDNYFDPSYINDNGEFEVEFGEKIYRSRLLYEIMAAHNDITNVVLSTPASDIDVNHYELPEKGTVTLTFIQY